MLSTRKRGCPAPRPTLCTDMVMCLFKFAPCDTRRAMRLVCREWNYVCTKYRAKQFECCGTPEKFKSPGFWNSIPDDQIDAFTSFICTRENPAEIGVGLVEMSCEDNVHIVQVLLTAGADVHFLDDMAVRSASSRGNVNAVRILLTAGADVNAENDQALFLASLLGHVDVVRILLAAGVDVHSFRDRAVRGASKSGHADVVRILLAAGADVHARNDWVLREASIEVFKVLLAVGVND